MDSKSSFKLSSEDSGENLKLKSMFKCPGTTFVAPAPELIFKKIASDSFVEFDILVLVYALLLQICL